MTYFTVRSLDLKNTLGCSPNSMWRWLHHIERERDWHPEGRWTGSTPDRFRLSDVVTALRQTRKRGLSGETLHHAVALDTSPADPAKSLGSDADARAVALHQCLTDEERTRFARVTDQAAKAAGQALWGKGHLYDLGRCLGLLILRPEVLAYVLTGERRPGFPDHTQHQWGEYIALHIVATATPAELAKLAS